MTGEITLQYPNKVRILVIELQNRSKMESGVRSEKELSKAIAALLTLLSIDVYQLTWTKGVRTLQTVSNNIIKSSVQQRIFR